MKRMVILVLILVLVISGQSLSQELEYDKKPRISDIEYLDLAIDLFKKEKVFEIISEEVEKKKDEELVIPACEYAMRNAGYTIDKLLSIKPPLKYQKDYDGLLFHFCTYFYYQELKLKLFKEHNWSDERHFILQGVLMRALEDSLRQFPKRRIIPAFAPQKTIKQGERDYEAEIKAYTKKKWPDDYEMQVYEYDKQMKAFNQIRNLPSTADYNESILLKAMAEWEENYEMVIYEYNNQLESYKKMR